MLALSRSSPTTAPPDRFRGTTQRWTVDSGPLAGTRFDCAFNTDGSIDWRVVAGDLQGRAGRARHFAQEAVRAQLFIVCFPMIDGETITITVDFASKRLVGFLMRRESAITMTGSLQIL